MSNIAVVVPTVRPEQYEIFLREWDLLFQWHDITLVTVFDGDKPEVLYEGKRYSVSDVMGRNAKLIYNKSDVVRNLGFVFIAKNLPNIEYIITLDDDTKPLNDTIADHIDALSQHVPISWMNTAGADFMRGVPYGVRDEAEVVLSHGVWVGVADWDAPTQLTIDDPRKEVDFYQGPIPKGALYPMCGMNIAFKRKMLPYMYFAPMGHRVGLDRFGDIWCGIESKRVIDAKGWAVVTGSAMVIHDRASNVFTNILKEAKGLGLNETYWKGDESDPYFAEYTERREQYARCIQGLLEG